MDSTLHKDMPDKLSKQKLLSMLSASGKERESLFAEAQRIRKQQVGNQVYFRGLIEMSNRCSKNCYYCGIRKSNKKIKRYNLHDEEILTAARFADDNNYGSLVLQAGEIRSAVFSMRIEKLVKKIKQISNNRLGITLSLGEQDEETYRRWRDAGAHRYLLRIETSNEELYRMLHPDSHVFIERMNCLGHLKKLNYQTGTGVMIGLPFQTLDHLAEDLLFMQKIDIDMVGMGPYIEHKDTPLYRYREALLSLRERFDLSLNMIASLRILMKDINIAAATALQAIDPMGREKAVCVGANVIMPNLTPGQHRNDYALYQNKPCIDEEPDQCKGCLDARLALAESEIAYGEWGDSKHYLKRILVQ